ncbi:hypothetical protein R1flu_023969 [Riccia fluitans]|uniref:Uncharacterized protein n=1 Tax=Riccia fluitans TaxID=41844 RepID=A0ABD1XTI7_9MARC
MRDLGLSNPPRGVSLLRLRKGQGSQTTTRADHRAGEDPANPPKSNGHLYSGRTPAGHKLGTGNNPEGADPEAPWQSIHDRPCAPVWKGNHRR